MSLAALYEKLASIDQEVAEEENEIEKVAAEYDAAGRIMARGFMDELNKLAEDAIPSSGIKIPSAGNLTNQSKPAADPSSFRSKELPKVKLPHSGTKPGTAKIE